MPTKLKDDKLAVAFLPAIVRFMVHNGLLTEDLLQNRTACVRVFKKHLARACTKLRTSYRIDDSFAEESFRLWAKGKKMPALVLFATAVEQLLNLCYRELLLVNKISEASITSIIRSTSIDAKLSWLMEVSTKRKFPKDLAKRLRLIADLRNSIVHYKAVSGTLDSDDDSLRSIQKSITRLGRISLRRNYGYLNDYLDHTLFSHDPAYPLIKQFTELILNPKSGHKKAK